MSGSDPSAQLTEMRERLGMTIRTFSQRLGVPETRYKNWEYGRVKNVPTDIVERARQLVYGNAAIIADPVLTQGFAVTMAVRSWSSASAAISEDGECSFVQDEEFAEVPTAFFVGGPPNADKHDLVRISGWSLSGVAEPGSRVLIYRDKTLKKNTLVLAQSPDGVVYAKVLRDRGGRWVLESTNEDGMRFDNLTNWVIHGYAVVIFRDSDDAQANITWPYGQAIKVPDKK